MTSRSNRRLAGSDLDKAVRRPRYVHREVSKISLKVALIAADTGEVDSSVEKVKRPEAFKEVLGYRQRFLEVD